MARTSTFVNMPAEVEISPETHYKRQVDGADFSLEANTPATPRPGCFYVLRHGRVVRQSTSYKEALAAYHALCRVYWSDRMEARDPDQRLAAAWGLVSLDPSDERAVELIKTEGDRAQRERLERIRARHRALQRTPFGRRKPEGAAATAPAGRPGR